MTKYEKYQLQWMIDHGYSLKSLVDELTQLQYGDPEDSGTISTPVSELFARWEADVGFGSEIWACEAEWKDCEGADKHSEDTKYLAICVLDGGNVKLVKPFDTYEQADSFIAKSAADMYDKISDRWTSDIDVWPGGAEVVDGEDVYSWQIYTFCVK